MVRADAMLAIEVVHSPAPRRVRHWSLRLAAGSTVEDALRASGLVLEPGLGCSVWGQRAEPSTVLRDGDRVELCRALTVDPKEARRLRYKGQRGARTKKSARRLPGAS